MKTELFDVRNYTDNESKLTEILQTPAGILAKGGIVAFPTETVYGLGANALSEISVKNIYKAKGRPSDNPLIVHIADISQLDAVVSEIPPAAQAVIRRFWPGPISIIMKKNPGIPDCVTAGMDTVAVRMPENPEAEILLRLAGCPVAAPSANLSGKPSPTKPEHVIHDLDGRVDGIILGRNCDVGIESTVLDVTVNPPVILRPGIITAEDLEAVIGEVRIALRKEKNSSVPKAPGMKYTHYAPDAPMILFEGTSDSVSSQICKTAEAELGAGKKIGIIATEETVEKYIRAFGENPSCRILSAGTRSNLKSIAHNVFDILRTFDIIGVDVILSEAFEAEGIGFSIMNRMDKAAAEIKTKGDSEEL